MDIKNLLLKQAEQYQSKPALIMGERLLTFQELQVYVYKLANAFNQLGISKNSKVGLFLPNSIEYVTSYLACFCLGAVVVPMDFMLKNDELASCLNHAEIDLLIAVPKPDISFQELKKQIPTVKSFVFLGQPSEESEGTFSFVEILNKARTELPDVQIDDQDPCMIMYTSGTIGRPKGILLNYKHLEGSPSAMHHFVDLQDSDVKLAAIPFSHIGGFIYVQNCILFGITLVIMERFNPFEFLRNIQQYKVTCFHIVPAMYMAMLNVKQIDQFDLSSLRWIVVFGAPSSPDILDRFHKYCPNTQLLNGWGMTETCPPNVVTPLGSTNIASVGKPAPHCKIRLVDSEGKDVEVGQVGELLISGWIVMDGYYKDPGRTAEVLKDGWLYTGDLARFDAEGFLYICGRKKEMIKVGGQIVFAPEVESAIYKHEEVAEAAVIGVDDRLRGEALRAFVVLKEGSQLTSDKLRYFLKEHLANFKVPHAIDIRGSLPKNRTGKIDKENLKTEIQSTK